MRASIAGRQMPTINGMVDTRPGEAMDTRVRDREGALSEDEQLGVVLVKSGIITIDQLGQALGRAKERGVNLARVLIEDKLLTEEQFVGTLAEQLGLEFVDLATYPVDPAAAALVSEHLARRYLAMPIGWWEGRLIVAMADPSNVFAIDDIRTLTGAEVRQVVVTAEAVTAAINKYYRKDSEAEHVSAEAAANSAPMDDDRIASATSKRSARTRRSCASSTSSSARRSPTMPLTSTSSRPARTCASVTGSTVCSTR